MMDYLVLLLWVVNFVSMVLLVYFYFRLLDENKVLGDKIVELEKLVSKKDSGLENGL